MQHEEQGSFCFHSHPRVACIQNQERGCLRSCVEGLAVHLCNDPIMQKGNRREKHASGQSFQCLTNCTDLQSVIYLSVREFFLSIFRDRTRAKSRPLEQSDSSWRKTLTKSASDASVELHSFLLAISASRNPLGVWQTPFQSVWIFQCLPPHLNV